MESDRNPADEPAHPYRAGGPIPRAMGRRELLARVEREEFVLSVSLRIGEVFRGDLDNIRRAVLHLRLYARTLEALAITDIAWTENLLKFIPFVSGALLLGLRERAVWVISLASVPWWYAVYRGAQAKRLEAVAKRVTVLADRLDKEIDARPDARTPQVRVAVEPEQVVDLASTETRDTESNRGAKR